jgi:iron complex transport system ATP-binding protein
VATADDVIVRATDVTVRYGRRIALERCTFAVRRGSVTALVGPNGSGKSSLLSAIAGLVAVAEGELEVLGEHPGDRRTTAAVAVVPQATASNETLPVTVREVVEMGRFAHLGLLRRPRAEDRRAVELALEQVEIRALAERQLRELSGGQRQRVLVAQGLAQQADLLLLDEPVTGLDLVSRGKILDAVAAVKRAGGTVVFSTHDLDDAELADEVLLLAGAIVASGPPEDVITVDNLRLAYGGRLLSRAAAGPDDHSLLHARLDEHVHPHAPHDHRG